jgi:hypothetical protein
MRTVLLALLAALCLAACDGGCGGERPLPPTPGADAGPPADDACSAHPCSHGSCRATGAASYTCDCDAGWTGKTCSSNEDDCADSPCAHGVCKDEVAGYACECSPGWTGERCATRIDYCAKNRCLNGGSCVNEMADYACDCPRGYSGEHCEHKVVSCADAPCAHGACADYGDGYECQCQPGWSGVHCAIDRDDCDGVSDCGPHGACVDGRGGYTCVCQDGWTGALCDQNIDDCTDNPCQHGGECVDGVNGFSCRCDEANWTGETCAVEIDACAGNAWCGAHGSCRDTADGFECVCAANWYGDNCSLKHDACAYNDCRYGDCVAHADSYTCDCQDGWEGERCDRKVDPCEHCWAGQVCQANRCVTGVVVPDVEELGMDEAGDAIVRAKLRMPVMPDFHDDGRALGDHGFVLVQDAQNPRVRVLEQNPAPGTLVAEGTPVALRVAIPPDDRRFLQDPIGGNNDTDETAQAYYDTIDPDSTRDTLSKWIEATGFNDPNAETAQVIYQNTVDLGFVRDMHMAKRNGRIAFYVKNHLSFFDFRSPRRAVATVAMEYGTVGNSAAPFITFYTFGEDESRLTKINLDGGGQKSQPGVCLTCHGGFTGNTLPKPGDTTYPNGGNTGARFIPFDLSLLAYENNSALGSTRAAQEEAFRKMNLAIKESYGADNLHAKELIDGWYASGPTFDDAFVPAGWTSQAALYNRVVKTNCRLCHSQLSGARAFSNAADFLSAADLIRTHIFERSSMPLARRTFYDFWVSYPSAPNALAQLVGGHPRDGAPVTGYLTLEFEQTYSALVVAGTTTIAPTKAAFVESIAYSLRAADPSAYRITSDAQTFKLSFDILTSPTSRDVVTIDYTARGRNGETRTGSFEIAVIPAARKLSFFDDGIAAAWNSMTCGGCHRVDGPAERAYIFAQSDDTIRACLNDPTGPGCSKTFVSKITPGDGTNSKLIRTPLDRLEVPFGGVPTQHPASIDADTEARLQQLAHWIDDGALP